MKWKKVPYEANFSVKLTQLERYLIRNETFCDEKLTIVMEGLKEKDLPQKSIKSAR